MNSASLRPVRPVRLIVVVAIIGLIRPALIAQDAVQPRARASVADGPFVVGQPVDITVEVLVPSYFTGAPRYPTLDVADALTLFVPRGANFSEREGGVRWTGQRRRYTVHPQRPGRFEIPALAVEIDYYADQRGTVTTTVATAPVSFDAVVPPEAQGLGYFMATTQLTVDQSLDRTPDTLQVGEAFTRTITVTVDDALAMVIPPLELGEANGLAAYPEEPVVTDEEGQRGRTPRGTRVETVTYVARDVGTYTLPPVELTWWDLETARLRTETVPALAVEVVPGPASVAFAPPAEEGREATGDTATRVDTGERLRRGVVVLGLVLAGAVLILWARRAVLPAARRLRAWRRAWSTSERAYFARFRRAARRGDARGSVRSLMAWLDRRRVQPGTATYREFAAAAADESLDREASRLDDALFAPSPSERGWSGSRFVVHVARARRRASRPGRPRDPAEEGTALNPRFPTDGGALRRTGPGAV